MGTLAADSETREIQRSWDTNPRWAGTKRTYSAADVLRLRGSLPIHHTIAEYTAASLWRLLAQRDYLPALGALNGNQAMQMVKAGLEAIYVSGWQIAADGNAAGQMYPDLCLYPSNSVPSVAKKINNALQRADQIQHLSGSHAFDFFAPLVADGDAGFGGVLSTFELMTQMIEAGVAGVHFEDQHPSAKKCGHLGGKVLVPTSEAIDKLVAARLAADVAGVPTLIIARTDANSAMLISSDADAEDHPFMTGERTREGFFNFSGGLEAAIARGLAFAPYADLIWCETSSPDLDEARRFAQAVRERFPGKLLAYNCSPSFNWKQHLGDQDIATFQQQLGAMGYKFQFVTLAGFHSMNYGMYTLAREYAGRGMSAYVELQQQEFAAAERGFTAVKHQAEVGTTYFDSVLGVVSAGQASTAAMSGSTETAQFLHSEPLPVTAPASITRELS